MPDYRKLKRIRAHTVDSVALEFSDGSVTYISSREARARSREARRLARSSYERDIAEELREAAREADPRR